MLPVLDVILGHKSAHSVAAGPMLAGLYLVCFVYCVLCFYLQNKDTPHLFYHTTFAVKLPLLDGPFS